MYHSGLSVLAGTVMIVGYALVHATILLGAVLPQYLALAALMIMLGSAGTLLIVSRCSSSSGTAAMVHTLTVIMLSSLISDWVSDAAGSHDQAVLLSTVVAMTMLTTCLFGVACLFCARFRFERFLHCVPWPVLAGILTGAGVCLLFDAVFFVAGQSPALTVFPAWSHPAAIPLHPMHVDLTQLIAMLPHIAAIVVISLCVMLGRLGTLSFTLKQDLNENQELRAAGYANICTALTGALPGYHSVHLTHVFKNSGRMGCRITVVLLSLLIAAVMVWADQWVVSVPRVLLGGLLMLIAFDLIRVGTYSSRALPSMLESVVMALIALAIIMQGFVSGLVLGMSCSLLLFVLEYSQSAQQRQVSLSGDGIRSNVDRTASELALLSAYSTSLRVIRLRGYLFFGSAHQLFDQLHRQLSGLNDSEMHQQQVIVDLERLSGLDVSAVHVFERLCAFARRRGFLVSFSAVPAEKRAVLEAIMARQRALYADSSPMKVSGLLLFDSLDTALQHREERLLSQWTGGTAAVSSHDPASPALSPQLLNRLASHVRVSDLATGETLIKQNEPVDALYIVRDGRLVVHMNGVRALPTRLRSVGPGALLGEMSFYLGQPASASVTAETPTRIWRLTHQTLNALLHDEPTLMAALTQDAVRILALRLADNSRQIRLLAH